MRAEPHFESEKTETRDVLDDNERREVILLGQENTFHRNH